jgi:hypothetical protein
MKLMSDFMNNFWPMMRWTWFEAPPSTTFMLCWVILSSQLHFHIYYLFVGVWQYLEGGARWSRSQCAWHAIAEAKQRSQRSVIGWVTKIYYLNASEGTLSRWSRLHLQSLAPTPVARRVEVRQAADRKNNCRIFITTWWKTCCTNPT